jgi:hypothetical protein
MTHDLAAQFRQLSPNGVKRVHHHLCAKVLEVWSQFAIENSGIKYVDSVVGLVHRPEWKLPHDAFHAAFNGASQEEIAAISRRYNEPLAALQDDDWDLPLNISSGYYAIFNAFRKYALGETMDDWLIVNQALSVSTDPNEWRASLQVAIDSEINYGEARPKVL